ncbi:MAG: type II secretion system protein [Elusimicrobia bacterium]|nr:type II secretion system protein [Elusimicrobiota bacterium]
MKHQRAFTLVELIIATAIFSFVLIPSLVAIYSTASKHMFQNYRQNQMHNTLLVSMKAIQNALAGATRVDSPAINTNSDRLAFAENVDSVTGCYPIDSNSPVYWHYFCISGTRFYYHRSNPIGGGGGCPQGGAFGNPYPSCGASTPVRMELANDWTLPTLSVQFTRRSGMFDPDIGLVVTEPDLVEIRLGVNWQPTGGYRATARPVVTTLVSKVRVNLSCTRLNCQ